MNQDKLLLKISQLTDENKSLIDVVSESLDISYASAQRRVSGNAKLSIEEAVKLAKDFRLSIDNVYKIGDQDIIPFHKTQITTNIKDFINYFSGFCQQLDIIATIENTSIIYATKDLAVTCTFESDFLSKFKIFVWQKLLNPSFKDKLFTNFEIPAALKKAYREMGEKYDETDVTEIWDITTLNSTLKQIHYYLSVNQLTNYDALIICKELRKTIKRLKEKAYPESKFRLYYNELIVMGNQIFFDSPLGSALYIQNTAMNFFKTSDPDACFHTREYLNTLLENSKLLNVGNEKEKSIFFNKLFSKIDSLENNIKSMQELDF